LKSSAVTDSQIIVDAALSKVKFSDFPLEIYFNITKLNEYNNNKIL